MTIALVALGLRYSPWSIGLWLMLAHAGMPFALRTSWDRSCG